MPLARYLPETEFRLPRRLRLVAAFAWIDVGAPDVKRQRRLLRFDPIQLRKSSRPDDFDLALRGAHHQGGDAGRALGQSDASLWAERPHMAAWYERIKARPSYSATFYSGAKLSEVFEGAA